MIGTSLSISMPFTALYGKKSERKGRLLSVAAGRIGIPCWKNVRIDVSYLIALAWTDRVIPADQLLWHVFLFLELLCLPPCTKLSS